MIGLAFRILSSPLLLSIAAFIIGGVAAFGGWVGSNDMALLQEKGIQAEAIVDGGTILTKKRSGSRVLKFDIHWSTPSGETLKESDLQVSSELEATLVQGDELVVDRFPIKYAKTGDRLIVMPLQDIQGRAEVSKGMLQYGGAIGVLGFIALLFFAVRKLRASNLRLTEN